MLLLLTKSGRQELKDWFYAPSRKWERILAVIAAMFYFAIGGVIARFFWGPLQLLPVGVLLDQLLPWVGVFSVAGVVLALYFPKIMLCVFYLFSLFGVGSDAS